MKTAIAIISLSVIGLSTSSALAQDAGSWSGFYVGVHAGSVLEPDDDSGEQILFDTNLDGNFGDTVTTAAGANAFSPGSCNGTATGPTPGTGCGSNDGGGDWGLRLGYDWQNGNWIFGLLGEYSHLEYDDAVTSFSTTPAFYTMRRELDDSWSLRGRVGYAFGPESRHLLFVTAGVVQANVDNVFTTSNSVNTFVPNSDDEADGSQWGLGYEFRLTEQVSLGIEYLATHLEDDGYRVRVQGPAPVTNPFIRTNPAGTDFRRSDDDAEPESVRLSVAWRF